MSSEARVKKLYGKYCKFTKEESSMDTKFTYQDGIRFMKELCAGTSSGVFRPESNMWPELEIHYPGYKKCGDYRLVLSDIKTPPCHTDICKLLFKLVKDKTCTYNELAALLEDIYINGTMVNISQYLYSETAKIVVLIYWITLQDEINYPQEKGYSGMKMPFCRYFEAIYCAKHDLQIDQVLSRCNNRGYRPALYNISHAPIFYN